MRILIAGDFCPQNRVAEKFEKSDYESVLGGVKDVVSDTDYSIVNFECSVTKGGEKPIEKCGPNLQCSEKGIEAVKWAGFDCVTLANNHFLDYGKEGVEHTLKTCEKYGIDTVGGGMNLQEASKILYKEIDGKMLAIINCCEHEFTIATEVEAGSNPLNPIQQFYTIQKAKKNAEYVLVVVHGGNEHYQLPSPRMKELYRFFVDAGADAVVNHHQHCYSGYEMYKGMPIIYGLGNFCFDWKGKMKSNWNKGYMVILNLDESSKNILTLYPYIQCDEEISVLKMDEIEREIFNVRINEINKIINDDKSLKKEYDKWIERGRKWVMSIFEPFNSHILRSLYYRNLYPSFIKGERLNILKNYLFCEAHFDQVKYLLTSINNKNEI